MKKIGILGGGVWGCSLAKLLSLNEVKIYARDKKIVDSINNNRFTPNLKFSTFNENVTSTLNLEDMQEVDYLFIALPSQNIREVLKKHKISNKNQNIIIASKGIEITSRLFLYDVVKETLKTENISVLSGPCFSHEVVQNLPTAVTLATKRIEIFNNINQLFENKNFRLYYSEDVVGCQLGGSLKNIYAIASGITNGLSMGENAKSALIARSFSEIIRLAKVLKADPNTLFGLSGLGDLILTCNSLKSRNSYFGYLISSQPKISIEEHLKSQETTEGYFTIKAVKKIANEKKVDMPIMNAVYNILYENSDIKNEIENLLERPPKKEFY